MTAERPSSPHTNGADSDLRIVCCCDCLLPFPAGIWPHCSDCGLFRCSGCELYLMVRDVRRVGFDEQLFDDALAAYRTRVARARATVSLSEESSSSHEPAVSATAPIPTRPPMPKLPSDWEAVWSLSDNAYYYWHPRTNHTQWEDPNWEVHEAPNITTVAVAEVVDWAEPRTTTGTASDSVWDPPPHTTWLSGTNSLPPPAPRSRSASSLTASDSSQPLTGRSSSIYE